MMMSSKLSASSLGASRCPYVCSIRTDDAGDYDMLLLMTTDDNSGDLAMMTVVVCRFGRWMNECTNDMQGKGKKERTN